MIKFQMFALSAVFAACAVLSACSSDTKSLIGDKIGSLDASSIAGMASGDSAATGDSSKSKKKYSGSDTSGADAQYIQPDDFFISEEPFKGQNWIRVTLAKQLKAPSAQTKSEGQFMQVLDECEFARYAPGDQEANMEHVYDSSIDAISKMEDNL